MKDAHILAEVIEIRDVFNIVCIMSKADVSDTIEQLTVGTLIYIRIAIVYYE